MHQKAQIIIDEQHKKEEEEYQIQRCHEIMVTPEKIEDAKI
jgi:hypothetical protein